MDQKISVIIPIYKVENYLKECLNSVVNQTYTNLEIILVDDGSPDNCPQICEDYASKDKRIKVIHKENGGLSSARNAGLEIATGEYIAFVDSDDWLELDMYELLLDELLKSNADVSICNPIFEGKGKNNLCSNRTRVIDNKEEIFSLLTSNIRFEVWNKLFRKTVVSDTRFIIGQVYEDLNFDRNVFSQVNRIVYIDKSKYHYRVNRPGSTNSSFNPNRLCAFQEIDQYFTYFDEMKWDIPRRRYLLLAMNFCINLYCSVSRLNAEKKYKIDLVKKYNIYYSEFKKGRKSRSQIHAF